MLEMELLEGEEGMEEDAREEMDWEEGEVCVPERSSDFRRVEKVRFVSSGRSSKGGESGEGKGRSA